MRPLSIFSICMCVLFFHFSLNAQNCSTLFIENCTIEDPAILANGTTDDCLRLAFPIDFYISNSSLTQFNISSFELEGTLETTNDARAEIDVALTLANLPAPFDNYMNNPDFEVNITPTSFHIQFLNTSQLVLPIPNIYKCSDGNPYLRIYVQALDGTNFPGDIYLNFTKKHADLSDDDAAVCQLPAGQTSPTSKSEPGINCSGTANPVTINIENLGMVNTITAQTVTFTANQSFDGEMDYYLEVVDEFSNLEITGWESQMTLKSESIESSGESTIYKFHFEGDGAINSLNGLFFITVGPIGSLTNELRRAKFEKMVSRVKIAGQCCTPDINPTPAILEFGSIQACDLTEEVTFEVGEPSMEVGECAGEIRLPVEFRVVNMGQSGSIGVERMSLNLAVEVEDPMNNPFTLSVNPGFNCFVGGGNPCGFNTCWTINPLTPNTISMCVANFDDSPFNLGQGGVDNFEVVIQPLSENELCINSVTFRTASITLPMADACVPNVSNYAEQVCFNGFVDSVDGTTKMTNNKQVRNVEMDVWVNPDETGIPCNDDDACFYEGITDESGYKVSTLVTNYTSCAAPFCNEGPLNGVTTFDMVIIAKHILNSQLFDSPYQYIAADANNSGSVTTFDLVLIRKLILFIDPTFSNNTSWRFVDAAYEFPNPTNPWQEPFPEYVSTLPSEAGAFVAIKIGDVNESAKADCLGIDGLVGGGDVNWETPVILDIEKSIINNKAEFDFKVEGFTDIVAYQMEIDFDDDPLAYEAATEMDLSGVISDFFGLTHVSDGVIRTIWYDEINADAHTLATNEKIFRLKFDGLGDLSNAEVTLKAANNDGNRLSAPNNELKNFAYDSEGKIHPIILRADWEKRNQVQAKAQPNPFGAEGLSLWINMPTEATATVRIFNTAGKTVFQTEQPYEKGENLLKINNTQNWSNGIYFYEISTESQIISGKMMKQ